MSYAQFKWDELGPGGGPLLKLLHMLRLVALETGVGEKKDEIRVNNLTLINFVIKFVGPQREDRLTAILLAIQVCVSSSLSIVCLAMNCISPLPPSTCTQPCRFSLHWSRFLFVMDLYVSFMTLYSN